MIGIIQKHDMYHAGRQVGTLRIIEDCAMGHSQAEKAENRERILAAAAAQIRREGLGSLGVVPLMRKVNLTHGGFYGHFASKSELVAEAMARALAAGKAAARGTSDPATPRRFATMVRSYLSRAHRDKPEAGCAIAALAGDVARADERSRAIMEKHIESFIATVAEELGDQDDDAAIVAVSALVGALTLSRVVTDPRRSDAILSTVRDYLAAMQSNRQLTR
jgi:TetR/AcrR family transcriptional regulator, transcriptional repressor for nem operon